MITMTYEVRLVQVQETLKSLDDWQPVWPFEPQRRARQVRRSRHPTNTDHPGPLCLSELSATLVHPASPGNSRSSRHLFHFSHGLVKALGARAAKIAIVRFLVHLTAVNA